MSQSHKGVERRNQNMGKSSHQRKESDGDEKWWLIPGIIDEEGYRQLRVWQSGMVVVDKVYDIGDQMPASEKYGLTAQLLKSAESIPSNLAEGYTAGTDGMYFRHVRIACGSAAELETQLLIARRRRFVEPSMVDPVLHRLVQLRRSLYALRNYLRNEVSKI